MMNEESAPAENQAFAASFPSDMSLGQKVLLTVFFAWARPSDQSTRHRRARRWSCQARQAPLMRGGARLVRRRTCIFFVAPFFQEAGGSLILAPSDCDILDSISRRDRVSELIGYP
jgi:hypothetical protein